MSDESDSRPLTAAGAFVRNPLSVIAMFVLLVEAIATVTLINVIDKDAVAVPLVWFIVLFPTLIALLFFGTLWWRHQFLYSPMEYRSDESFLTAMQRLQRVEARQEAADLNPRTADEAQSLQVVDRLLEVGDVRAAVKVGRTFLEASQHDIAARVFEHIVEKTPARHEARYNALANLGYAQIGLKQYDTAVDTLEACLKALGARRAGPWHHMALAYAHYMLSQRADDAHHAAFVEHLAKGKAHRAFRDGQEYRQLYPEIAEQIGGPAPA